MVSRNGEISKEGKKRWEINRGKIIVLEKGRDRVKEIETENHREWERETEIEKEMSREREREI